MSTRILRVNELLQRELGGILRKRYQQEAAVISVIGVSVAPDLKEGKVFVAITGNEELIKEKMRWLSDHAKDLRHELSQKTSFKHMPLLSYEMDTTTERGNRVLGLLDELDRQEKMRDKGNSGS